jgi:SH3-like domain-containing protein
VVLPTRTATPVPSPVLAEPSLTPTPSLQPSATNTPAPTSFPAEISAPSGNGAVIRENPSYDAAVIQTLLNGTPVEVLSTEVDSTGAVWANIRFLTDREGWIVQSLLHVNSPAP